MSQSTDQKDKRKRNMFILLAAAITAVVMLVVAGLVYRQLQDDEDGFTNPVIQTDIVGGAGLESAAGGGRFTTSAAKLLLRLSEGQALAPDTQADPLVSGTPLTEAEVAQILARLPELTGEPDDIQEFNVPDTPLPPPRPGETISQPFPPPPAEVAGPQVVDGPLEVLRFTPEGEIGLAPFLNVTFNQPMVPLTDLESLSAAEVPVTLTPDIPGVWQWLSPQTLRFEFQSDQVDRLPMATEFVAEIPAGTESVSGNALAETVRWTFSTPPVQLVRSWPNFGTQPLEPVMFVAFDQLIEPTAVLNTIQVTANGSSHPVRLATAAEVAADEDVSRLADNTRDGYWLALRPQQPFPADAFIQVTIGPGTPSAEGPRLTTAGQSFEFNTYPPLRIIRHSCGWSEDHCPPLTPFIIEFSNQLDPEQFDEEYVRIEPELPGATIRVDYNSLIIQGVTAGRTTYQVTVDGRLQDVFGQTLGEDETLRFEVDTAVPFVNGPRDLLVTVDPSATQPQLTLYVMNYDELQLQVYAVEPGDWSDYTAYRRAFDQGAGGARVPGTLVLDEMISIEHEEDVLTETAVNLQEALAGETGHLIVVIQPPGPFAEEWQRRNQTLQTWVQVTQIGLDAFVDNQKIVAWATDLTAGEPIGDALIQTDRGGEYNTDTDGIVRFDIPAAGTNLLIARRGDDVAILPASSHYWDEFGWQRHNNEDELRWHVFDDRSMYRPGEEVHLKGWLRQIDGDDGQISMPGAGISEVTYVVRGPQGNEIADGRVDVNAFGGFDFNFTIPENSNLGYAFIDLWAPDSFLINSNFYHEFQIQEFRRPEFEVSAHEESSGPYVVNDAATVAVTASYFAGGPLANAETNWLVTSTPSHYAPPNWPDFNFGQWIPWWFEFDYGFGRFGEPVVEFVDFGGFPGSDDQVVETFSGVTDAAGEHYLQIDFEALEGNQPFTVRAEASVMDVNRQTWAASTHLLVHPADLYVGLRSQRTFVEKGDPLEIELIVTDIDGNAVPGTAVEVQADRLEWQFSDGRWQEVAVDSQTCTVTSAAEPVSCTFATEAGGEYEITAMVTDSAGRQNQSSFTRWVSGGKQPVRRNVEHESLTLIPDRQTYQPGDVAEILVQAPFNSGAGLMTLSHGGMLTSEPFQLENGSATLRIAITEDHISNLSLQVDVAGATERTDDDGEPLPGVPPRPAFATGTLNLDVPPYTRELSLAIEPQADRLEPGAETAVSVTVTDAQGQPVPNAEVALVVVDEAILALTNYQLANPLDTFYSFQWPWLQARYGRDSIILVNPENLGDEAQDEMARVVTETVVETVVVEAEAMEEAAMDDMAGGDGALGFAPTPTMMPTAQSAQNEAGQPQPEIQLRTNFDPLAVFAPTAQTDSAGQAQVTFTLPDNLTRYRIMAVAVAGDRHFGAAESNLTARLPLMVRPSAPRFLNFGDTFELPVVLQNQTDEPLEVAVAVATSNLTLTDVSGQRVTVPANDRVEVRFPAAAQEAGAARFQVAAVAGEYADAATGVLPVYTPATTEAFATYGVLDAGAIGQPFVMPEDVIPAYGGLEIGTSSTALQALTDAVLYLTSSHYDSSEELASRILSVAALRDVLTAFDAEGLPSVLEMETAVLRDIERLQSMQNFDGGFPYWQRGRESIPFHTIHVAHALAIAEQKGFAVPAEMAATVQAYLRDIEEHYPSYYGRDTRWALSAYALYVRHLAGDSDPGKAQSLLNEAGLENLTIEAAAWLWPILADDPAGAEIQRHLNNRAVETAGAANFITSYGDDAYLMLHSDRRSDGVILNALINQDPQNDLIPKVVNGLLAHRVNGRWRNTQENVFILLALDNYFNTFEAQTPDFVAQIWLGDTYAGAHEFSGRTTERNLTEIPMSYLASVDSTNQDLILSKEGPGRLYYRLGLNYAPADLTLDALNRGFVVQRTYEAVDDPEDVFQDEDGIWRIKLGARVRVKLTMVADNRRYHVALVDPLPAGLEAINPALAVSQSIPQDPNEGPEPTWWWGPWYQHQNMRDERLEAFTPLLWEGAYEYEYVARATTPGTFVTPPTKAEEMYSPEVFGRGSSDVVIVED